MTENWKPVTFNANYEVSDHGRIRSLRRESVLDTNVGPCGYHTLRLTDETGIYNYHRVGTLIAAAFLGPITEGAAVRRLNGHPEDDILKNIAYGTAEQEAGDYAARARREEAAGAPTHCPSGHRYDPTYLGWWSARLCRPCRATEQDHRDRTRRHKRADDMRNSLRNTACIDCGFELVNADLGSGFRYCADCGVRRRRQLETQRRHRKRGTQPRTPQVNCLTCGVTVSNPALGTGRKYCDECTTLRRRDRAREAAALKRAQKKKTRTSNCQDCGQAMSAENRPGPVAKRCPQCRLAAQRQRSSQWDQDNPRRVIQGQRYRLDDGKARQGTSS